MGLGSLANYGRVSYGATPSDGCPKLMGTAARPSELYTKNLGHGYRRRMYSNYRVDTFTDSVNSGKVRAVAEAMEQ